MTGVQHSLEGVFSALGGKQRHKKSGIPEIFTILTSPHRKKGVKVLIPNRNPVVELYRLFPQLQPGEKPVNGFTCALHKDILLQGRIVICTNCICFHSNIFGYETRLIIYFKNVLAIRREKTAFVVPNAISIRTVNKRYLFCSFLSRESVFKLLLTVWKSSLDPDIGVPAPKEDIITTAIVKPEYNRHENTDYNANRLLISSSASYDPPTHFNRKYELTERPSSSPPSLYNLYSSCSDVDVIKPHRFLVNDSLSNTPSQDEDDDDEDESVEEDSEMEIGTSAALKQMSQLRSRKLFKSNTVGDLRELQSVRKDIGPEKIGLIGRNLVRENEKSPISITPPPKSYISSYFVNAFQYTVHLINWLCMKHTAIFFISFLFLLLALLSLSLMVRINNISNGLQKPVGSATEYTSEENAKMQHLFKYQDDVHTANVERMKTILSLNIETVNEVQEALRQLRERLKQ